MLIIDYYEERSRYKLYIFKYFENSETSIILN